MSITQAKKIGFCFGVKRAVNMAEAALAKTGPIYSLGSIIHNKQVVEDLSLKGLKVIKDINKARRGVVVISSHGIGPGAASRILKNGMKMIDTTCPFVQNAQRIAKSLNDSGYTVVIVGDARHPEVRALVDHAPKKAIVVKDRHEAAKVKFLPGEKISVISQTTQSSANFADVVKVILEKGPKEARIFNTICKDAEERQSCARGLASKVDLMLIIGGRDSANTKRLFEVCREILKNSHLVETEADLNRRWFDRVRTIGITSGASTPDWVVKKVVKKIKNITE